MSQINLAHGSWPSLAGKKSIFAGPLNGPKSYATGGDPVTTGTFGYYINALHASVSVSGLYTTRPIPSGAGERRTWKLIWIVISSGLEVSSTTDLSAETVIASGFGGVF